MMENKDQPLHASTSEAITNNVRVEVESRLPPTDRSRSSTSGFRLHRPHQQRRRRQRPAVEPSWIITDATGHTEEVRGRGVVGEQPCSGPASRSNTSSCELNTSAGVMRGTYQMVTEDGEHFDVEIAPFALHEPYTVH